MSNVLTNVASAIFWDETLEKSPQGRCGTTAPTIYFAIIAMDSRDATCRVSTDKASRLPSMYNVLTSLASAINQIGIIP